MVFEERKKHSTFSWREFNRLAGFSSPNYLKLVCDGKSKLSKKRSSAVAAAMNLSASEQEFFEMMVAIDNTTNEAYRFKGRTPLSRDHLRLRRGNLQESNRRTRGLPRPNHSHHFRRQEHQSGFPYQPANVSPDEKSVENLARKTL